MKVEESRRIEYLIDLPPRAGRPADYILRLVTYGEPHEVTREEVDAIQIALNNRARAPESTVNVTRQRDDLLAMLKKLEFWILNGVPSVQMSPSLFNEMTSLLRRIDQ